MIQVQRVQENKNLKINDISSILNHPQKVNKIFKDFYDNQELNILDLGCGFPYNLITIYHRFKCNKLIGVDFGTEESCLKYFIGQIDPSIDKVPNDYKEWKTFYDTYNSLVRESGDNKVVGNPKIENQLDFNKIIINNIHFETRISDYLNSTVDKFDLIIASNVLHFIESKPKLRRILEGIKLKLKEGGTFYFRIQFSWKRRIFFDYNWFKETIGEIFNYGYLIEIYDGEHWEYSIFNNKINHASDIY